MNIIKFCKGEVEHFERKAAEYERKGFTEEARGARSKVRHYTERLEEAEEAQKPRRWER